MYFYDRVLLFPQRWRQGHDAANAASRGHQPNPAPRGGGFMPLCWVETDDSGNGNSERLCDHVKHLFQLLASLLKAALLKIACGKEP